MKLRVLTRLGALIVASSLFDLSGGAVRGEEPAEAATPQYNAAVRLQNLASYDLAAEAWQKFLAEYPADSRAGRARHYLGVCYFQLNKPEQAIAAFKESLAKDANLEADLREASQLYLGVAQYTLAQAGKAEMYDTASDTFNALITKFPKGKYVPDALFYRGECFYARGKKKEAAKSYSELIAAYPEHKFLPDALYALGVTQEELNKPDEAGKTYEDFLAKFPKHALAAEVTMRRGETLFAAGQYAEAAKRFSAAAAAPGFSMADYATLRQGDALAQLQQYPEAAAAYAAVVEKFATSQHAPKAALAGGKCYYLAGKQAEARQMLEKAVAAGGPSAAEAAHWTAKSLMKDGKPADALAVVEKAIPQSGDGPFAVQLLMDQADAVYDVPDRRKDSVGLYAAIASKYSKDALAPQAAYMAGFAALEEGLPEEALKHATAFLAAYASNELVPDVMHVAAESHLLLKQLPEAEKLYAELLAKYSNHTDAGLWQVRLGLARQLQKKYQESIDGLQPALAGLGNADLVAEAQYLIGGSQLELGQADEAIASLEASLAAQPKWRSADETMLLLAAAYRRQNDAAKARDLAARVIAEFPNSQVLDRAHYRLGEYQYVLGDLAAAMAEYRLVIDNWSASPLVPNALHELGCAQLSQKDAAGADQTLSALIEKYAGHALLPRAHYARGMARQQLGNYAGAMDDLQAALAADPAGAEKSDALYVLGLAQMGMKQYGEAAKTFGSLLEADAKYTGADNALYQLGWALKLAGKEPEAADAFGKLAEAYPDSARTAEARYHVGEYAFKIKDYAKSAVAYYMSMKKAGRSDLGEKAAHKLGWSYYNQADYDNARKTFHYQQVTYPQGPLAQDAIFMEGECLFKLENFAEALAAYERVEKLEAQEFEVLRLLHAGQAAAQLKHWQKSLELLSKCLQAFPDAPQAPEVMYEQAWALQNLGQPDKAQPLYEMVIAKTNREVAARAQFMIGELQFKRKDYAEAVKSFFKVTYGYGFPKWQAEAAFEAARCFEVLGKKDQALKLYQELVEKYPDSDKVVVARQRIEELQR